MDSGVGKTWMSGLAWQRFAKDARTERIASGSQQCRLEYPYCRACGHRRVSKLSLLLGAFLRIFSFTSIEPIRPSPPNIRLYLSSPSEDYTTNEAAPFQ